MTFVKGHRYILTFFYTGTREGVYRYFPEQETWTNEPQKEVDTILNDPDFDEGFVIIYPIERECRCIECSHEREVKKKDNGKT